eukprot:4142291-Pyramimonas_sp.AAC.2
MSLHFSLEMGLGRPISKVKGHFWTVPSGADVTSLISKWQQMQVGSGRKTACVPPDVATSVLTLVAKDFEGVQPSVFAGAAGPNQ